MTGTGEATTPDDWDEHWAGFNESAATNPAQHYRHNLVARLVREMSPKVVLDVGSGQGDLLQRLNTEVPTAALFGVELSAVGVSLAQQKVAGADVRQVNLLEPAARSAIADIAADVAVCVEVLEHLDNPDLVLSNARYALAEGARVIVTVPGGPMSQFDRVIGHRRHYDAASLRDLLEGAGFEVVRIRRAGFPFFNLYRLVVVARGKKLADDVGREGTSTVARFAMKTFALLFHANLSDSRWGWQMVAEARKRASA